MRGSGSSSKQPRYGTRAVTAAAEERAEAVLERDAVTFFLRLLPRQARRAPPAGISSGGTRQRGRLVLRGR